ncbi:MAG: peptidoglycan-associated lipoprotein Pal [Rickettsiaceae bacterium]|nr:peptidoglycan-associated lipoprotein Pal [Rickettsiaceae bacterium]
MLNRLALLFCVIIAFTGCSSFKKHSQVSESEAIEFEKNIGDRVYFALDKHQLSQEAIEQLDRQIAWLNAGTRSKILILVEGHCDDRGTREYNLALGEKRAYAVKSYLIAQGVDASRIEITSYGKEKPAVLGDTEEAYRLNRRAVTVVK